MVDVALNPSDAVELALNLFGDDILRLSFSYLGRREDAEDVVQETLIRFMQSKAVFEDESNMKSWLLRVAANLCKDFLKSAERSKTAALPDGFDIAADERTPGEGDEVLAAVLTLPEKYRSVIHLYYYEEYTTGEIADILGKKEVTVRSLLKRAREKLMVILSNTQKGDDGNAKGI